MGIEDGEGVGCHVTWISFARNCETKMILLVEQVRTSIQVLKQVHSVSILGLWQSSSFFRLDFVFLSLSFIDDNR